MKVPEGLCNVLKTMYRLGSTWSLDGNLLVFMWHCVSQGCLPLSLACCSPGSSTFFLRRMCSEAGDRDLGSTRAYADDIGCSVKRLQPLSLFKELFNVAGYAAALFLKHKKSVLIPPADALTTHLAGFRLQGVARRASLSLPISCSGRSRSTSAATLARRSRATTSWSR
jgi:hypothetical protein